MNTQADFPPLKVVLPQELQTFYAERGYLSTQPYEDRRYARLNVRSQAPIRFFLPPALLDIGPAADDLPHGTALVKDLSRTGIAILYHRQIFPGERFEVLLHGRAIDASAVRCRRVGRRCYETGAIVHGVTVESDCETEA
jgi:hypothetical protein